MVHVFSIGVVLFELVSGALALPAGINSETPLVAVAMVGVSLLTASWHVASKVFPTDERWTLEGSR